MNVPLYWPIQCTCCDIISHAICYTRTYPVATQKGVADYVYINYNACA